jgi:hypothetical protein
MIKIKRDPSLPPEEPTATLAEVFQMIEDGLKKIDNRPSSNRLHSIESHLRGIIRRLGFRVRETADKKASVGELAAQCRQALGVLKGEAPADKHEVVAMFALVTLSNITAEVSEHLSMDRTVPEDELPTVPETAGAGAIMALLMAACLMLFGSPAQSAVSFNITNVIAQGVSIVSYPTNGISTNLVTLGTVTNIVGSVTNVSTNALYAPISTGNAVETRNYAWGAFKFTGLCTSSNGSTIVITPVRAVTAGSPPSLDIANGQPLLQHSDFETLSATNQSPTLAIPIPRGTNVLVTWMTNLDEWYTKPADWIGIYSITNIGTPGDVVSNAAAFFGKKIMPFSLSGGNF